MSQSPGTSDAGRRTQLLHVHDLPQLYTRPTADSLLYALQILQKPLSTFGTTSISRHEQRDVGVQVEPDGVPRYLTSIIASPLEWIAEEEQREQIWELASARLSERSGRSAAKDTTRSFAVHEGLVLELHEPSLTEDSLGFKTWTSSLLLARRLNYLSKYLDESCSSVLELGAGTGLVGLAAASVWRHKIRKIVLTDLPAIVPNLQRNIEANSHVVADVDVSGRVLDWSESLREGTGDVDKFPVLVAADPIYGSDHPRMLVDTITRYIAPSKSSIFILELPVRGGYTAERSELKQRLSAFLELVEEGNEVGYDDWEGADGQPAEVECWWSVWKLQNMHKNNGP